MSFFLETVLPSSGMYCVVGIRAVAGQAQKQIKQTFHTSLEDVQAAGEVLSEHGWNAYMAMSTFKDSSSREAANALYTRAFFLDLDCGKAKNSFDTIPEAMQALRAFIDDTGLPKPFIVHSGNGIHAHWPIEEELPTEQWLPYAKAFKALCLAKKLTIDPVVPADAARILRIPGTKNYNRNEPESVAIAVMGTVSKLSDILKCLPTPKVEIDLSAARAFGGADPLTKSIAGGELPKSKFSKIVKLSLKGTGCKQIAHAITDAATLEEPLWRAALSVAWHCTDAETSIQKLSSEHPEYTPENTLAKAQQTKGPYTCTWYRDNYPSNCEGCKQKVTSPIALGRFVEPTQEVDGEYVVHETVPMGDSEEEVVTVVSNIPKFPFPYFRPATGGVARRDTTADGETLDVVLYPHDLYVTGRYYDSTETGDGMGELVGIRLHLPRDGIRDIVAPVTSLLTIDKLRDTLVSRGVIAYGKQLDGIMAYLASAIRQLQTNLRASQTRNQMGWLPDNSAFVLGEFEYTPVGIRMAPPASTTRTLAPQFHPRGTMEEWKQIANFYGTPGMEAHALAFFSGFGSPLLKFLGGATVKGVAINLVSNKSGTGKTTVQMAINSIYGHPVGLMSTKSDTANAKYMMLGMLNHLPFCTDEVTNLEPDVLSQFIYDLTQGRGRHRMEGQKNQLRENHSTWANISVLSSNSSLVDKLLSLKANPDGELRRLIELQMPIKHDLDKAATDALFAKLERNYGIAGPKYIAYVVANVESITQELLAMQRIIDRDLSLTQSDRFYSVWLACCFVGAAIARRLGIIDIPIDPIYAYAIGAVQGNCVARQEIEQEPDDTAMSAIGKFINRNINNGLIWTAETELNGLPVRASHEPRGSLKFRWEVANDELWIPISEIRDFFTDNQIDVRNSMKVLAELGMLKTFPAGLGIEDVAKAKRLGAGLFGTGSAPAVRCYCFKASKFGLEPPTKVAQDDAAAA